MNIRLRFFIAGFFIGLAELLPGISGATVALMFGIYKKLIECISRLKDFDLLVPLILGMAIGVFGFSKIINFLFLSYRDLFELFMGIIMIYYGAHLFISNSKNSKRKELIVFLLLFFFSAGLGIFVGRLSGFNLSVSIFPVAVYGFIAFSFLLIPGISGSAFLLAIGIYPLIIESISNLNFSLLLPFGIGMFCSLLIMPRLIQKLLDIFDKYIFILFAGFIFGAGTSIV